MRRWLTSCAGVVALGCSSGSKETMSGAPSGADADPGGDSSTAPTGTSADTAAEPLEPTWMAVAGFVQVTSGLPDPLASDLTVSGLGPDEVEMCTAVGAPAALADVLPLPPGLVSWWDVVPPDADVACALPSPLRLGLGPYDALLDPAADAAGVSGTPYGLYTTGSDDSLWVFGVAGTASHFAGTEVPALAPPLADGYYRIQSLVLLPL